MHSKIIDPRRNGRFVFANRGSCQKTVSYLGHEAKATKDEVKFFHHQRNDITSEEVRTAIDQNSKGLRKKQEKFYSLVLSPSQDELAHLGNDQRKLQQYTRQVMENYARNFTLPDGKQLRSSKLLWFATIHQERKEKEGDRKGVAKSGHHTHIHILVSGQDREQKYRLNPKGRKHLFLFKDWQIQNGKTFQQLFDYHKPTISEKLTQGMSEATQQRHQERIRYRISYLNEYFTGNRKIDVDKAMAIGKEQQYGKGFFFHLSRLTKQYQAGKMVHDPYQILQTGKDATISFPERTLLEIGKSAQAMGQDIGSEEPSSRKRKLKKHNSPSIER
jgi:hypothetical protein